MKDNTSTARFTPQIGDQIPDNPVGTNSMLLIAKGMGEFNQSSSSAHGKVLANSGESRSHDARFVLESPVRRRSTAEGGVDSSVMLTQKHAIAIAQGQHLQVQYARTLRLGFIGNPQSIACFNSASGAFEPEPQFDLETEPGPCKCDNPEEVDTIVINVAERDNNGRATGRTVEKKYSIYRCIMPAGQVCYYIQIHAPGTEAQKNSRPGMERRGRRRRVRVGFIPIVNFVKTGEVVQINGTRVPLLFVGRYFFVEVPDCNEDVNIIQIYWSTRTYTFCDGSSSAPVRTPSDGWAVDGTVPYGATLRRNGRVGGAIDTPGIQDSSGENPHRGLKLPKEQGGETFDVESDHLVQHFMTFVYCGSQLLGFHTWDNDVTVHFLCPGKALHNPPVEIGKLGGPLGDGVWKDWDDAAPGEKIGAEDACKSAGLPNPDNPPPFKR